MKKKKKKKHTIAQETFTCLLGHFSFSSLICHHLYSHCQLVDLKCVSNEKKKKRKKHTIAQEMLCLLGCGRWEDVEYCDNVTFRDDAVNLNLHLFMNKKEFTIQFRFLW